MAVNPGEVGCVAGWCGPAMSVSVGAASTSSNTGAEIATRFDTLATVYRAAILICDVITWTTAFSDMT
ncbi:hypothetical protein GCM10017786_06180 [Amycolatopsis deserti]|uniref:Uncharacterized protein n=1 Tax=Amycolatopsis deserti TaxID=185696 RepID=A0ABQ3IFG5_9PSEU|nr:hypothetical protein GCM10017786_06180 [Amycolatopsis deserti]